VTASKGHRIRGEVNRGLGWVGLASTLVSLLDFVAIIIILAFYVSRTEYGIATKAVWVFPLLDLATDLGLSAAVIQRDDHTEAKISTVFWLNVVMSLAMFGGLYALSGPMSAFYGHEIVGAMVLAYGAKLIWQNVYFMPMALMRRELRYRDLSLVRVIANIAEFAGKLGSAMAGAGVWCFVIGPLCRALVTGIGVQLCHPWRPRLLFRLGEATDYARFGFKTSASKMLFYFYTNIDYPIVGYFFGDAALGLYRWAYEVVLEPVRIISDVIVQVAFPAFARLKHARDQLIEQFIAFARMNLVTVMSFLAVVFVVPEEILYALFRNEYLGSAPAVRVLCAVGVLRALGYVVPPLLDGTGYAGRTLVYQTVAAIALPAAFMTGAVVLGDRLGFLSVAVAWAVGYPLAFAILIVLALGVLQMSLADYLGRLVGIPLCVAASVALGFGLRLALADAASGARLAVVAAAMLTSFGTLLAYTQGISPRSIGRALRG
jgi:O-antigen/teichoic acid export membrane protein